MLTHHSLHLDVMEFYYNTDPKIDMTSTLTEDFNKALVKDGYNYTILNTKTTIHMPFQSVEGATYSYRATMQMIMDTTIDPELYPSLLI